MDEGSFATEYILLFGMFKNNILCRHWSLPLMTTSEKDGHFEDKHL